MSIKETIINKMTCDRCGISVTTKLDITGSTPYDPGPFKGWKEVYSEVPNVGRHSTRKIICPKCYEFYSEMLENFFSYCEEETDDETGD